METKAQASANSSEPRLPPPIQLRPLETQSREEVAKVIEGFLGTNWRISHHLNKDKDAQLLSTKPTYVWQRQGRNRAGLLVLQAGQPAIYWNTEQDCPYTLKLQVPATFTHVGVWIIIATLSRTERLLTLEDVWAAGGQSLLQSKSYSERWPKLCEAYVALSAQQYFLGCELRLVQPLSLAQFAERAGEEGTVWEFQPDVPMRRRLVWMIPGKRGETSAIPQLKRPIMTEANIITSSEGVSNTGFIPLIKCSGPQPKHVAYTKPTTRPQPRIRAPEIAQLHAARLKKDSKTALPDSYLLEAADNFDLGRVCVPTLTSSQQLRQATTGKDTIMVEVRFNSNFKKYEVVRLLDDSIGPSPANTFTEAAAYNG
jgi:hypothetical protein